MLLKVEEVTKVFNQKGNKVVANDNVSFEMDKGEIFGLLGHNGAGKTTIINQIMGLLKPTQGNIYLNGKSVVNSPNIARHICSVQPQSQISLNEMTPKAAISIMGEMRGLDKATVKRRSNELFESLGIIEWVNKPSETLSGGVKRLTTFCMAVIAPGELVILDEPTNDVDPVRRRYLWEYIGNIIRDGTSIILVTHNVLEAEKVVDRVAIMDKGRFVSYGNISDIKKKVDNLLKLEMTVDRDSTDIELPNWAVSNRLQNSKLICKLEHEHVQNSINWVTQKVRQGEIMDYSVSPTTLEDVYVELTSEEGGRAE
ncbi:MAG: ATP-binding cassette domain-containing protein [Desulfovibrionales bacterium]|nr:ATP-binding cassette domain-containing protein [Desulfovibrionales bacterium]